MLTDRLLPRVLRQAWRMLGDAAEAEDVAQDAMLKLWRQAGDWRPGEARISTWLYRVTRNLCIDRIRKRRPVVPVEAVAEPVDPAPSPRSLRYLGPFSKVECSGAHSKIRQLWLWEDGGSRYGVGIFATLIAGRQAGFVTPVVMGEGAGENGGWRFAWPQDGRSGTAFITLKGGDAILTLDLDGRDLEDTDRAVLESGAVFYDERIDLAPLTTGPDWRHWFDTVLIGHFVSGYVPAC